MYIKAIAEQGSILKAAERMYVTPSALSKHVQKMESALGVKLFDRVGKKFVLTYPGERYLYWQERMLALRENMDEEMDGAGERAARTASRGASGKRFEADAALCAAGILSGISGDQAGAV